MLLKKFTQGAFCLMLGGVAGYHLRTPPQTAIASSSAAGLAAAKAAGASGTAGQAAEAKNADGSQSPAEISLGERMKALLDHYNEADARKHLDSLSESDLRTALALVASMPKSPDRDSLRANLYRAWAKKNPTAAWKAALADTLDTDKNNLGVVAGEIAKTMPDTAVGLALSLGMGNKRSGVLQQVFDEWGKVDLAGAVGYLNKHPDLPTVSWAIAQAIAHAGEKDPLQASTLALTLTDQQMRSTAVYSLMEGWASRDPKAALSWARSISNPALQQEAISNAIRGWATKDPVAAIAEAQTIQDASTRSSASQAAWVSWFQKDPDAAMAYLGSTGDEKMLQNIRWQITSGSSLTPQETAALVDKLPDGKAKEDMVQSLAENQIQRGRYSQAIEMLNNVPDSQSRDGTLERLGEQWGKADPNAVAAWLKVQPDSSDRDVAVAGFAAALARTDPQGALQWADTIPDPSVKSAALKNIAVRWMMTDPVRAEAWISGVPGWSDAEKQDLRRVQSSNSYFTYAVNVSNRR